MLVSVLPDELIMVSLQVSNINLAAVDLLRVLFYENERQFVAFTRTDGESSLILKQSSAIPFRDIANARISPMSWRALSLCNDEEVTDGLVTKLLSLLAIGNYSIFYLSTATQDYILVKSNQLEEILHCLTDYFTVDINIRTSSVSIECERISPGSEPSIQHGVVTPQTSPFPALQLPEAHRQVKTPKEFEVKLALLPDDLCLHSLSLPELERAMKPLIRVLLIDSIEQGFFSFAMVEDQVSMILDKESARLFTTYADIDHQYKWRAFKVLGDWGFSEIGLVNSLSNSLASAGIEPPLFLSTFSRDFIIVQSDVVDAAKEAFVGAGFMVSLLN